MVVGVVGSSAHFRIRRFRIQLLGGHGAVFVVWPAFVVGNKKSESVLGQLRRVRPGRRVITEHSAPLE